MNEETVQIKRFWVRQPDPLLRITGCQRNFLSVRMSLWFAVQDILRYFSRGSIFEWKMRIAEMTMITDMGLARECHLAYIPDYEQDLKGLYKLVRALCLDTASARAILCDLGGLTDPWDAKAAVESEMSLSKLVEFIDSYRKGVNWSELVQKFLK